MTPDERLTSAWAAMHAAHEADVDDETDQTPVPPGVYAEVRKAEEAWMVGKTIECIAIVGELTIMTFTDGTRASFEANATGVCGECLDSVVCEPLLHVREDVDCRQEIHGRLASA